MRGVGKQKAERMLAALLVEEDAPVSGTLASVRRIHTVVHSALNQGIRWGLLSGNPAQRASPGQVDDRDIDPPAPEDLLRLFDAAEQESPDLVVFLVLAAVTGAWRSELCALRWSDIGLGLMTIARGIVEGSLDEANERRHTGHIWPAGWVRGKPTALIEKKTKGSGRPCEPRLTRSLRPLPASARQGRRRAARHDPAAPSRRFLSDRCDRAACPA